MGLQIILNGSSFTNNVGVVPTLPQSDSMKGLYFLGKSADKSCLNYATGKVDAEVSDASSVLTYSENYISFSGNAKILTELTDTSSDITIIGITKSTTTNNTRPIFSNYSGNGLGLFWNAFFTNPGGLTNQSANHITNITTNNYGMSYGRINGTAKSIGGIANSTKYETNATLTGSRVLSSSYIAIGGNPSDSYGMTANLDICAIAIWNKALTDNELMDAYNYLKDFYAKRDFVIA